MSKGSLLTTRNILSDPQYDITHKAAVLLDCLERHGVKYLVFDWDFTILNQHSGGFVEPAHFQTIVDSITEDWIIFITQARKRGFVFYIATFSDMESVEVSKQRTLASQPFIQVNKKILDNYFSSLIAGERLVTGALKSRGEAEFGDEDILLPKGIVAKYPENYQLPDQFAKVGLRKPMKKSKSFHLDALARSIGTTKRSELVLFDDDATNITDANQEGYFTVYVSNDLKRTKDTHGFRLSPLNLTLNNSQGE